MLEGIDSPSKYNNLNIPSLQQPQAVGLKTSSRIKPGQGHHAELLLVG